MSHLNRLNIRQGRLLAQALSAECCIAALDDQGHPVGAIMTVEFYGDDVLMLPVQWNGNFGDAHRAAHQDRDMRVEHGAYAVALLLVSELTDYWAIEQSSRGNGFDFHLARKGEDSDLIFNNTAALEVSGIHCQTAQNTVERRIQKKIEQIKRFAKSESDTPEMAHFVSVTEFGSPRSKVVEL